MKPFIIYNDRVSIANQYGNYSTIFLTPDSGKVYYRYKINTITNVKHPGIFLGIDNYGNKYFIHNHIQIGRADIVKEYDFTKGNPIALYTEKCSNSPKEVISIALNSVFRREKYHFMNYNCQTFANEACNNQRNSESVENWTKGIVLTGLALAFVAIFSGD